MIFWDAWRAAVPRLLPKTTDRDLAQQVAADAEETARQAEQEAARARVIAMASGLSPTPIARRVPR